MQTTLVQLCWELQQSPAVVASALEPGIWETHRAHSHCFGGGGGEASGPSCRELHRVHHHHRSQQWVKKPWWAWRWEGGEEALAGSAARNHMGLPDIDGRREKPGAVWDLLLLLLMWEEKSWQGQQLGTELGSLPLVGGRSLSRLDVQEPSRAQHH